MIEVPFWMYCLGWGFAGYVFADITLLILEGWK